MNDLFSTVIVSIGGTFIGCVLGATLFFSFSTRAELREFRREFQSLRNTLQQQNLQQASAVAPQEPSSVPEEPQSASDEPCAPDASVPGVLLFDAVGHDNNESTHCQIWCGHNAIHLANVGVKACNLTIRTAWLQLCLPPANPWGQSICQAEPPSRFSELFYRPCPVYRHSNQKTEPYLYGRLIEHQNPQQQDSHV